jgi:hypothetical protein
MQDAECVIGRFEIQVDSEFVQGGSFAVPIPEEKLILKGYRSRIVRLKFLCGGRRDA